jgi:hypothetical protein
MNASSAAPHERDTVSRMLRRSLIPIVMFVLGAVSVLAWQWTSHRAATGEQSQTTGTLAKLATVRAPGIEASEPQQDTGIASDSSTPGGANSAGDANSASDASMGDAVGASPPRAAANTAPAAVSPEGLARLSADATGQDPRARAAAIVALGSAPKADAAPVLEKVLTVADDADRPLALRSLRALARNQGDSDDRIRSVVRKVLYHESDESFTQAAQATLDDIERDLDPAKRAVRR